MAARQLKVAVGNQLDRFGSRLDTGQLELGLGVTSNGEAEQKAGRDGAYLHQRLQMRLDPGANRGLRERAYLAPKTIPANRNWAG